VLSVGIGEALWSFADRRGWVMTWWKWLLVVLWYAVFCLSFYAAGTLVGELEPRAGLRALLLGLFLSLVLGVGLVRVLALRKRPAVEEE